VLDVESGDHGDAGVQDVLNGLPASFVNGAPRVCMGDLVDQSASRLSSNDYLGVHLFDGDSLERDPLAGDDLECLGKVCSQSVGPRPHPPLSIASHHVPPA
jgi:hypothetical protein